MRTLLLFPCLLFSSFVFAQVNQATLTGSVTDPSHAEVPGARVVVTMESTGVERSTLTSKDGDYTLPGLPIGAARVTVSKDGFQTVQFAAVHLAVSEVHTLNALLPVSSTSTEVVVQADAPVLQESSAEVGTVITPKQVSEIPLNGRNWMTLTKLAPFATDYGTSDGHSIRMAGHGVDDNNFRLDGTDFTGIRNQAQRTNIRLSLSEDAIAEFRVSSALYPAEFGGSDGGQINVATKAGTNSLHGSVFEFLRNDFFDARSPTSTAALPLRLNQFGGSLGGPIVRDKSFFFASYEGLQQRQAQPLTGFVPTDAFRAKVLAQSPVLQPILDAYPKANASNNGDPDIGKWTGTGTLKQQENFGLVRFDHRFTGATSMFARFNIDDIHFEQPMGDGSTFLKNTIATDAKALAAVVQLEHVFSPTLLNEVKAAVNREPFVTAQRSPVPYSVAVAGFTALQDQLSVLENPTLFTYLDNLTWNRGKNTVKAGIEIGRIQLNEARSQDEILTYSSRANFIANKMDAATLAGQLPTKGLRKTRYFAYLQDEYKVRSNITVNVGVRYELYNVFSEIKDRALSFDIPTCGGYCPKGSQFYYPDYNNLDPRIGLTWAPAALHDKTVIRAGSGIYHGDAQLGDQTAPVFNDAIRYALAVKTTPGLSFPIDPFLQQTPGVASAPRALQRNRHDLYAAEWGVSIQQQLSSAFVGEVDYIGQKGTHVFSRSYVNVVNPATGQRPLPQLGQIDYKGNNGNSSFQGAQFSLQRQFRDGLLISAGYLWSHSIDDDAIGGGDAVYPQNVNCRPCERASSDSDLRHTFNMSSVYELPFGRGSLAIPGRLNWLAKGWQLSGTGTARSGKADNVTITRASTDLPDGNSTSPQRPDRVPGVSLYPAQGQSPKGGWVNIAAFAKPAPGTWGNSGRNPVRGPNLWQIDTAVSKRTMLTEHTTLNLRAEAFNLFNRAQYGEPLLNVFNTSVFGTITNIVNTGAVGSGTPRQLQFMLRIEY